MSIFITIFLTVISGVAVALLVQIVIRFVLDPLKEFQTTRYKVGFQLDFYADFIGNPGVREAVETLKVADEIRESAMLMRSQPAAIYKFDFLAKHFNIPSIEALNLGSRELIVLSNSLHEGNWQANEDTSVAIRKYLRLPTAVH